MNIPLNVKALVLLKQGVILIPVYIKVESHLSLCKIGPEPVPSKESIVLKIFFLYNHS